MKIERAKEEVIAVGDIITITLQTEGECVALGMALTNYADSKSIFHDDKAFCKELYDKLMALVKTRMTVMLK
jgi:hypothetical protein